MMLLWTLLACTPQAPPPDVLLVTLDTVRADRIGAYGYADASTPHLDALAARGERYDAAISPLPLTIPAHASLFTGLYPPRLGLRANGDGVLGAEHATLAEHLQGAGWATAASVSAFVTTRIWGFDQGFDAYFDAVPEAAGNIWRGTRDATEVVDEALAWWGSQPDGRQRLLWVHLYDAHFPYTPPEPFASAHEGRPYDGEIAYVDAELGRLLDAAGPNTLVVVASDHGEGLGEHDELTHGLFTYQTTQRVPLIVAGPGVAPAVVSHPVSLVDVLPTVLSRVGVEVPEGLDGQVLPGSPRPVYAESWQPTQRFGLAPHLAVVDGATKLIDTPDPELYALDADPSERTNLASTTGGEVERLRAVLRAWDWAPPGHTEARLDPEVAQALGALGYVEPGPVVLGGDDPKRHGALIRGVQQVERRQLLGGEDEALALLDTFIDDYPELVELHARRALMLIRARRMDEAEVSVRRGLELDPEHAQLGLALGGLLSEQGRHDEALAHLRRTAERMPFLPRVRAGVVRTMARVGDGDEALAWGERALGAHPGDDHLAGAVGVLLAERGRLREARPLLERGVQPDRPEPGVRLALVDVLIAQKLYSRAEELLAPALAAEGASVEAHRRAVRVAMLRQRWSSQIERARAGLAAAPGDAALLHGLVLGLFNLGRFEEAREVLDEALDTHPRSPDLVLMDANLLDKEGHPERARARFEVAQRLRSGG